MKDNIKLESRFLIWILQFNLATRIYHIQSLLSGKTKANPDVIIGIIRLMHILGKPLKSSYVFSRCRYQLYFKAVKFFGSWEGALRAAGLDYFEIKRKIKSEKTKEKKEAIILKIKNLNEQNKPLNYWFAQKNYRQLLDSAIRHFQNWRAAIEAAGIAYEGVSLLPKWDKKKVLAEIKNLKKKSQPLNSRFIEKNHGKLRLAAMRYFENWGQAVDAAGFDYLKECRNVRIKTRLKRISSEKLAYVGDEFATKNKET